VIITNVEELRKPNDKVNSLEEALKIIKLLEKELSNSKIKGVGLAAPQIGIHKKVAIVRINDFKLDLINPIVVDKLQPIISKDEGCLSLPGVRLDTQRFNEIFIKTLNYPEGLILTEFPAIVALHEIDHTEGILIIDRAIGKGKVGRNDPCPCGRIVNNKPVKFKKCHGR